MILGKGKAIGGKLREVVEAWPQDLQDLQDGIDY
jgi:hypothetical protein